MARKCVHRGDGLMKALLAAAAALAIVSGPVMAQNLTKATINIFATDNALSVWVAKDKGLFEKEGLDIEVFNTPSSGVQMQGLADGRFQFAETALDNIIAYQEGQGTA